MIYKFNQIEINTDNYRLLCDGLERSVEPQVFNLIVFLIQNKGRIVSRAEILEQVWKDRVVSDSSISNHIKTARKTLGDDGSKQQVIKTVHSRGYQFIANCEILKDTNTNSNQPKRVKPQSKHFILLGMVVLIFVIGFWKINQNDSLNSINNKLDNSIAVLAFEDLSPNNDQNYFAQGISEELLNIFTQIPNLRVASRTSSFSYKNKDMRIEDMGKELNVRYLMEGSVRKSENKIRVTAQLIRVSDGSHIWSETYDHEIQDLFKVQDQIATAVSHQLQLRLSKESNKLEPIREEAHAKYLKALYYFRRNTPIGLQESLKLIDQSISEHYKNPSAWALKSRIHYRINQFSNDLNNSDAIKIAKESALKAKSLDNTNAMVNAQMAIINLLDFDYESAQFNIELAMSFPTENPATIELMAYYYQLTGQIEHSIKILEQAIDNDPVNDTFYFNLAMCYFHMNKLKDAYYTMNKYHYFHSEAHSFLGIISQIYVASGKNERALEYANAEPSDFHRLLSMAFITFSMGDVAQADKFLSDLLARHSNATTYIASLYAFRKEFDEAFRWLDLAYKNQDTELLLVINSHHFRSLWTDIRWKQFLNKINLPKQHWLLRKN